MRHYNIFEEPRMRTKHLMFVSFVIAILMLNPNQLVQAFWLTDSTLFQPLIFSPTKLVAIEQPETTPRLPEKGPRLNSTSVAQSQLSDIQSIDQQRTQANSSSKNISNQEKQMLSQQQQQCSCSADWLEAQTQSLLNKWTGSVQFASQLKSLIISTNNNSSLNHAIRDHEANKRPPSSSSNNSNSARWPVVRGKWSHTRPRSDHGRHLVSDTSSTLQPPVVKQAIHLDHHHQQQQQQQQQMKSPERSPKNEHGRSGLISVRDRNELFDLSPTTADQEAPPVTITTSGATTLASGQSGKQLEQSKDRQRRLAFIEQEQALVVETSAGWRPVQLLAPLRDFRKTIAKFSLSSAEDRRKLMDQVQMSGSIRGIGGDRKNSNSDAAESSLPSNMHGTQRSIWAAEPTAIVSTARGNMDSILGGLSGDDVGAKKKNNNINSDIVAAAMRHDDGNDDEEDEEEEDEDEEDEEEEDSEEEMDKDEDDTDLGMMSLDLGDDVAEQTNAIAANKIRLDLVGSNGGGGPEAGGLSAKHSKSSPAARRRAAQISGRSAASGLREANERDESRAAMSLGASRPAAAAANSNDAGDQMKLRLIALNEPFSGNVHGLRGANFECKRNAARAQIRGAFRALLATSYQSLNEILRPQVTHKYPVVNLRGELLASSWSDLFKSPARVTNPLGRIQAFDGRHIANDPNWPNKLVWLGTGNKLGARDAHGSAHNCDSWHSDSLTKFGYAVPLHSLGRSQPGNHSGPSLTTSAGHRRQRSSHASSATHTQASVFDNIQKYPCRMPLIVLCIETVAQIVSE